MEIMKITTIGLGYIGLPTSAMFANHGLDVVGVDVSVEVVKTINRGDIHIEEPGLGEMVNKVVNSGNLRAELTPKESDVFIIAVPTPNNNDEYKSCDLSYVVSAINSIIPYIKKGNIIIVESTIAPRTMDDVVKPFIEESGLKVGQDIYLAHCPERVLPGQILHELIYNNRIVGGVTKQCAKKAAEIYKIFVKGEIIETEAKTAEMSKLMENTFRDVNIALANELTKICNNLQINVLEVINMANKHPRVNIHSPGPGVGGHCLAVDPYFIVSKSSEYAKIINLSREVNSSMPKFVADNISKLVNKEARISAFGVTYKGNVDDMRESPAIDIINILRNKGYEVVVHDPHVNNKDFVSKEEACENSELILILTDHNEFKSYDYDLLSTKMKTAKLFDSKNIIDFNKFTNIDIINFGNLYKEQ
jgi:UDP-N-acetyl-D-mannosaminuronic acid dehydrogenase